MKSFAVFGIWVALGLAVAGLGPVLLAAGDDDVIRLRIDEAAPETPDEAEEVRVGEARRGFDYSAFQDRLESLWFQRKTFLASRRTEDANRQLERIRSFCAEEGIRRLEHIAGALIAEARRDLDEGNYVQALTALHYAEAFDPGRSQVYMGRAAVHGSQREFVRAATDLFGAVRASVGGSLRDLTLLHQAAYVLGISLVACVLIFSMLMLYRYQLPFRHEVEEIVGSELAEHWGQLAGWSLLALPLWIWIGAGWAAVYWVVITFRYMRRAERLTATALLLICALAMPAYRIIVGLYGTTADPAVRTTISSVRGEYSPDRIIKLRRLVETHPDDPVYRFLLAGLFKNGRYFEEAFDEYKAVLDLDPTLAPAYINVGNIFYATGQYAEAIANYRRGLELDADSFLAYFNMHLAQSEAFRFRAAEDSLRQARSIDSDQVAELLSSASGWGDRPAVQDASLRMASIWDAALDGSGAPIASETRATAPGVSWSSQVFNPIGIIAMAGFLLCFGAAALSREGDPARRCVRCGRAFCSRCKSSREAREYCTQCVHMYVLGDGLAPGTKERKLYEVERHKRRNRLARGTLSAVLPGSAHLLRGDTVPGSVLLLTWFACLIACAPTGIAPLLRLTGIHLRLDLLDTGQVPHAFNTAPLAVTALLILPLLWCLGNVWRLRRTEA